MATNMNGRGNISTLTFGLTEIEKEIFRLKEIVVDNPDNEHLKHVVEMLEYTHNEFVKDQLSALQQSILERDSTIERQGEEIKLLRHTASESRSMTEQYQARFAHLNSYEQMIATEMEK